MKLVKKIVVFLFMIVLVMYPMKEIKAASMYSIIDYSERAYNNRVNMLGKPGYGDCAIASIASIEAYWANSTDNKYDEIHSMFPNLYVSKWEKAGYTSKAYDLQSLYQALKDGPVIVHRNDSSNGHYSVVVAYEGNSTVLELSGFKVMEVQRYERTDGSYGYPTKWNTEYYNAVKIPLSVWGSKSTGNLDQICVRNTSGGISLRNPYGNLEEISAGTGNFKVAGWVFDEDDLSKALQVHVYIGNENAPEELCAVIDANLHRSDVANAYPGVGEYHGFSQSITTNRTGNQTIYVYAINIGSGNGNPLLGKKTISIVGDTESPVISNVKITEKTKDGYTVTCTVTDNVGVNRVQFPTWTAVNDQDDIASEWWTNPIVSGSISGSQVTFHVKTSDHNGEMGLYATHIYAYDNSENHSCYVVELQIEDTPPTISNVKVTNISEAGYTVTCTVTDNVGVDRVQFPTWTLANDQDDLASEWWTNPIVSGSINGSQATFHVRTSDHGNELGTYRTHIYAYDACGNRTYYGVPDVVLKKPPVLQAPKTLTAELYGYDDVKLSWSKSTDADGYNIYYKKSTASKYTKLASTTSLTYKKADLADGTKYAFKIVPYYLSNGQKVESANSKAVSIYTLKKLDAPKIAKASSTQVKVSWSDISGESGYQLSVADSKTKTNIVSTTTAVSKTRNATKNKTYYYKVRAYRTVDGKKIYGPWSDVKGYNLRNVSALPRLKANLYGHDDVKLSWKKSTGANQYRIYYKKSSDKSYTYLTKTTKNTYSKANLTDGAKYTFKVVPCYTVDGEVIAQGTSKTVSIYTLKKLNAPKISKVSSSQVKVTWNNISGESGYQISRSASKTKTENVVTVTTTKGTSKNISVKKGKTYYYKVRAYKTVDGKKIYSPWSAVTSYKLK